MSGELFGAGVAALAAQLYGELNDALDSILGELRRDMIKRTAADDAVAFFVNRRGFQASITNAALCRDLLQAALYRLARYEADR